jgi:hypothetical protein
MKLVLITKNFVATVIVAIAFLPTFWDEGAWNANPGERVILK